MNILALEPYYGGSHQAFLEGWSAHSGHRWTLLGLPAHKWKWRMRHAAITLAAQVAEQLHQRGGAGWDLLLCSDMLNLAEFRGLAPAAVAGTPAVAYFHENQLTYPVRVARERDLHFAMTNLITALASEAVWFNSAYHRDTFLAALEEFLRRMPDYQPLAAVQAIRERSAIQPPGITPPAPRPPRQPGPLRILWAARWEHDKNPEDFFKALQLLENRGADFRVSVIGQQFQETPEVFHSARLRCGAHRSMQGYQPDRCAYEQALLEADVVVCTAHHEFFGIGAAEAIAAGAYPLLPRRLAYPELLAAITPADREEFLYDGTPPHLADRLAALTARLRDNRLWGDDAERGARAVRRFFWAPRAALLDEQAARVAQVPHGSSDFAHSDRPNVTQS